MTTTISKMLLGTVLVAGAFGFALPALAQEDHAGTETIIVTAPRFHVEGNRTINEVPEKVSLSVQVRYDDLDLRSGRDAHTLRERVRDAAEDVCKQLADAYPFHRLPGTRCYREALQSGLIHANEAIHDAREGGYYR